METSNSRKELLEMSIEDLVIYYDDLVEESERQYKEATKG